MADDQEHFSCPMCLELLKDPVTTACGHTYCMSCINTFWDQDNEINSKYCCPLCRQTFTLRPVLKKNTLLAEMVEKLRNTTFKDMTLDFNKAEHGDVECDICAGEKRKAVKSCLMQLSETQQKVLLRRLEISVEIQKLREAGDSITNSAWTAVDDFDRACDEHIRVCVRSVERRRSEVKELVRAQQGAALVNR
ncbi:E3 ubiquitin/ISG15 ligase TRIM25-like isoform X3 [Osmerus eperlanus]|uniref:E3 ubiquitin/ISG15 ligase TRIM25-like isoform X3 n=1 Tax=Osmerus eperlanus TaxID=29151 RepID=UPI002E1610A4